MATVNANGIDLYYEESGDGTPILGIHGTPSSAALWEDAAAVLAKHGRCIIYDRRGFHRSERPDPFEKSDLAEQVDDAAALLDALSATPAVVIGRSTGGQIALELARRHPSRVEALVLLEAAVFTIDPEASAWAAELRRTVLRAAQKDPYSVAETVLRIALGDQVWDSLPPELKQMFARSSPAVLAEIRGTGLDLSAESLVLTEQDLAEIAQPTLIVSSEDSPDVLRLVNSHLAKGLPHAETLLVTGGHLINPAHPGVLDFIDRLSGRPSPP
ncbi:alpha/beta fold hydrolase [Arthrobacter rhizosphaerae]|uniref:alpha/beta fold hydrolase n=1 Tax=Arthrobacter rhizosphaerae TaxID=2855490 RepID=UPI001FF6A312|nr:alpha/beta hydrolase [Arthrobacter rhizosphaerae]